MDKDFEFNGALNIRFGEGSIKKTGEELKKRSLNNALIITDQGCKNAGLLEPLFENLKEHDIKNNLFCDVEPNPRDTTIQKAYKVAKEENIDCIVGLGGGSSLDTAKGVALLMTNPGNIKDYAGSDKVKNNPLPMIAIPTTAGTGSEVTANSAITDSENHIKLSIRSPKIIPDIAILDPLLLATLPQDIAAYSGMDALTHAIEGYLSKRSNFFSDFFALESIRILSKHIMPFYADPSNTEHAGNMLIGSMFAGLVISNTGTGNIHALARALGGDYDLPHGLACSVMFPKVLEFNIPAREEKYLKIAEAMGLETRSKDKTEVAKLVPKKIEQLMKTLNMPLKLSELGVEKDKFKAMAEVSINNVKPNPRRTNIEDLIQLLEQTF